MEVLESLKELYKEEIKKIVKKGELSPADSEAACKAVKAWHEINELLMEEESLTGGMMSERRGRNRLGQYTSRNDRSTADRMIDTLERLRMDAHDDETCRAIDRCIKRIEEVN